MRLIEAIVSLCVFALAAAPASAEKLKGDRKAVALAEKMIERLGGKEVWAGARSLYVEYEGWRVTPSEPVVERSWRDLREPYQHAIFEGRSFDTRYSLTPGKSWLSRTGKVTVFSEDEHQTALDFWPYDFYTIIANLAAGDPRIRLKFVEPRRIEIRGEDNAGKEADWGWFEIDDTGQPIRWGASYGDDPLEYLYGPVKSFGNIGFPAWGTASDGAWRFNYTKVDVSRDALEIELTPPE